MIPENLIDFRAAHPGLRSRSGWSIGLEGAHQRHNAAVALATMDALRAASIDIPLEIQRAGLAGVCCEGRVQRFTGPPEIILDTSHNIDSIKALRAVLLNRPARGKTVVVFGTSADKDAEPMLATLCEAADVLILTRYWSNPRWYDPTTLAQMTNHSELSIQPQPDQAFAAAREAAGPDGRVVICGSFFLAAELLPILRSGSSA
jgi:dihydrofolate synthase/folylpolyglutamate synthase